MRTVHAGNVLSGVASLIRRFGQLRSSGWKFGDGNILVHRIDCSADPFIPDGWVVLEHRRTGELTWNARCVTLGCASVRGRREVVDGATACRQFQLASVMNANVLDYLLKRPELIPNSWRRKSVFFLGTKYLDSGGFRVVRYLYYYEGCWQSGSDWLGDEWEENDRAAVSRAA